jgi:hypothetical protein
VEENESKWRRMSLKHYGVYWLCEQISVVLGTTILALGTDVLLSAIFIYPNTCFRLSLPDPLR